MNGFGEDPAMSRWARLPDDPPALRRWLADRDGAADDDWPEEEPR
jgi:hypothetical protein